MSPPHPPFDPMQQAQQLFAGHHPWLLSRLKARLRNTAEAQDVASETFCGWSLRRSRCGSTNRARF
jgi:RNA polymerase sigma-70 factor (ECF subfamily)